MCRISITPFSHRIASHRRLLSALTARPGTLVPPRRLDAPPVNTLSGMFPPLVRGRSRPSRTPSRRIEPIRTRCSPSFGTTTLTLWRKTLRCTAWTTFTRTWCWKKNRNDGLSLQSKYILLLIYEPLPPSPSNSVILVSTLYQF